jgi:hypothetical protein
MDLRRADLGLGAHHMKARGNMAVTAARVSAPDALDYFTTPRREQDGPMSGCRGTISALPPAPHCGIPRFDHFVAIATV